MFARLYHCAKHGDVWEVEHTEIIDCENDEVYPIVVCGKCYSEVTPVTHDGLPSYHLLTEDEMFWEMQYSEDFDYEDGLW